MPVIFFPFCTERSYPYNFQIFDKTHAEYAFQAPTCMDMEEERKGNLPDSTVSLVLEIAYPEFSISDKEMEKFINDTIRGFIHSICIEDVHFDAPYKDTINKEYGCISDKPSENFITYGVGIFGTVITSITFYQDAYAAAGANGAAHTIHPLTVDMKNKTILTVNDIINKAYFDTIRNIVIKHLDSTNANPFNITALRDGYAWGPGISITYDKKLVVYMEYSWGGRVTTEPVTVNPALYPGMIAEKYAWFIK